MDVAAIFKLESFQVVQDPTNINRVNNDFYIFNDIRVISPSKTPVRLEATVFSICLNGYTRVAINMQEYFIGPGTMIIAMPDQIVQSLEISDEYQGICIAISKDYTDEIFPKMKIALSLYFYTKEYPCLNIKGSELNTVMEYYNMLWERTKEERIVSKGVIQSLLAALMYEVYAIYRTRIPRKEGVKNRKEMLLDQFIKLLSVNYRKERSVNYYANLLFVTPKHLSSVIKEVSGKTAGEWIDHFVLFEAKSLLQSSKKTIQEIANELNFANQSFFGKYFKHYTGISPKAYRKK